MEIIIDEIKKEYYCKSCHQLRGSFEERIPCCRNCGCLDIIVGNPNELNKELLQKEYE